MSEYLAPEESSAATLGMGKDGKRSSQKIERAWILNDWANSAYTVAITTAILPLYFKDVIAKDLPAHISTAYLGYANTIASFLIAICAPLLGTLADYRGFKMPFFMASTFIGVLFTGLLAFTGEGHWLSCLMLYGCSSIGFAAMNLFYDAFLTDVTTRERYDWVSASGYAWGYIGSVIPFLLSILLILKWSVFGLPSVVFATKLSFVITAIWWLGWSLPMMFTVRQRYCVERSQHPIRESFVRLRETLRSVREHRSAFQFLIAYFFYIDGVSTIIKMATAFGKDLGLSSNLLLIIVLFIQIASFPAALLFGKLAGRFGNLRMLVVGIVIYIFITLFAVFIKTALHFWILAALVALAMGGVQSLSRSAFAERVPPDKSAEFFGLFNISGRFAAVLGPALVGVLSQLTGNSRYALLSLLLLFAIGMFLLLKVRPMPANPS